MQGMGTGKDHSSAISLSCDSSDTDNNISGIVNTVIIVPVTTYPNMYYATNITYIHLIIVTHPPDHSDTPIQS